MCHQRTMFELLGVAVGLRYFEINDNLGLVYVMLEKDVDALDI